MIVGQVEFLLHREPADRDPAEERECLEAIRQAALAGRDKLRDLHHLLHDLPGVMEARAAAVDRPAGAAEAGPVRAEAGPVRAEAGPVRAEAGARVLVIDDETEVRGMIASLLRQVGYEVDTAEDGAAGLEAARHTRFDCVIVDLEMPGLSGLAVTRVLKDRDRDAFVLLLTGDEERCDAREYQAAGVDRRMVKPFERQALLATVQAACAATPRTVR